ncbi:MAG: ROK family protein [Chitinophagaceae bacterium]
MEISSNGDQILSVDIGGSNIKATLLNCEGEMLMDYQKLPTPDPASPSSVINIIQELSKSCGDYNKVSVGFPGYVRQGIIHTAPNLNTALWKDVDLSKQLSDVLGKPVRILNDADMLGLGVIKGKGFEMVITLGTGFGTAFVKDGKLLPHLELGQHPVSKDRTYDQYVGEAAFVSKGLEKWNERMQKVIDILKTTFNYDQLYIGGGNAKKLSFQLEENMILFSNRDGIRGGARLWHNEMD